MLSKLSCLAALTAAALAAPAFAQVPTLVNGNLETVDPYLAPFYPTLPYAAEGWRIYNYGEYRFVGDGLENPTATPPIPVTIAPHSGIACVRLPGGEGRNAGEFEGVHSENQLNQGDPASPRNWPEYTFSSTNLQPVTISCWFNIPASDPMVKSRFGMKINLLDTNDPGIFFLKEWLDIDPEAVTGTPPVPNPAPGCTIVDVTTPEGVEKGIHTNGQWVHFVRTLTTADLVLPTDPTWTPPTNPAHSSILAERFDIFPEGGTPAPVSHGSVWVDDITFTQASACHADFNGDGSLSVQDIFDFLTAWFAATPSADFNGDGHITVQDIFDFLSAWFAGC